MKQIHSKDISIVGAGRTDTGVHARGQVAHFDLDDPINPDKLRRSLNGILKPDIRIKEISVTDPDFHARYSAISRLYRYYIAPQPTALFREFAWQVTYDLDLKRMNKAAEIIAGRNDFKSFCRAKSDVNNHFCRIEKAEWLRKESFIVFEIQANRFLHGMVRALVGTFVDIGRSKLEISDFKDILKGKDRSLASQTAPPKGLILEKVYY